jgi:hypothetical protein
MKKSQQSKSIGKYRNTKIFMMMAEKLLALSKQQSQEKVQMPEKLMESAKNIKRQWKQQLPASQEDLLNPIRIIKQKK